MIGRLLRWTSRQLRGAPVLQPPEAPAPAPEPPPASPPPPAAPPPAPAPAPAPPANVFNPTWEQYAPYVSIHPAARVEAPSSIKLFRCPEPARTCVSIDEGSHIFSIFSVLRAEASIRVGKRCQLGFSQFIAAQEIVIGADVLMSWGVTIMDSDTHSIYWEERQNDVTQSLKDYVDTRGEDIARHRDWSRVETAPIRIGDKCWIGFNVTILKGVTIGEGCIIGAGSVVTHDIPPWTIAAGNPCKPIKQVPRQRPA